MVLRIHEFPIFTNTFAPNQLTTEEVWGRTGTGSRVSILSANIAILQWSSIQKIKGHRFLRPIWSKVAKSQELCKSLQNLYSDEKHSSIQNKFIIHTKTIIQILGALEPTMYVE